MEEDFESLFQEAWAEFQAVHSRVASLRAWMRELTLTLVQTEVNEADQVRQQVVKQANVQLEASELLVLNQQVWFDNVCTSLLTWYTLCRR